MTAYATHPDQRVRSMATRLAARGLFDEVGVIARRHHVTFDEVASRGGGKMTTAARRACWAWLRGKGFSYSDIGRIWDCHHTTVMSAMRSHPRPCAGDGATCR